MAFTFVPTNATSVDVCIGVKHLLSNYIIQDETITESIDELEIPDQQGRTAQVYAYQKHYDLSFTCVGPTLSAPGSGAANSLSWYTPDGSALTYIIETCEVAFTNNDVAKWNVTAKAYINASYNDCTDSPLPQA